MRTLALVSIPALAALALLVGPARAQGPADHPLLVEQGETLFRQHCAVCHGLSARGDGVAAPALRKAPADLTGIARRRGGDFPAGDVAAWIDGRFESPAHGSREMPIWGVELRKEPPTAPGLEQEEVRGKIDMLVAYLRWIQVLEDAE